jgi:inosose dehydratase
VTPKLASAPVTWGVWEQTTGRDDLIPPERLLDAVQGLGFTGIELGPPGYFGADGAEAAAAVAAHGLALVGGFVPLHLDDEEAYAEDIAVWLDPVVDALVAAGAEGPAVLADAGSPERAAAAGKPAELERTALAADAFARAAERVDRAVARCHERGVAAVFHHHLGTYVESPAEIAALLEHSAVDLCFDTGHAVAGGGDAVEVARLCGNRIAHFHVKDVDGAVLEGLRSGRVDMQTAWAGGIFCPLGEGVVDLAAVLAAPSLGGFAGWVVLEQDRVAVAVDDLPTLTETEGRNLAATRAAFGA